MLSRVAESFYWIGRNVERAETVARTLDVSVNRAVGVYFMPSRGPSELWRAVTGALTYGAPIELQPSIEPWTQALSYCAFSAENESSLVSCVRISRANALGIKSELSTEAWEFINSLYLDVERTEIKTVLREGPSRFLRRVRDAAQSFAGVTDATLRHGEGWEFLQIGRFLERASLTIRILDAFAQLSDPAPEWQRLLEMCCSREPYMHASHGLSGMNDVFAFLLMEAQLPRSVRFSVHAVDEAVRRLSGTPSGAYANETERLLGSVRAALDFAQFTDIAQGTSQFLSMLRDRSFAIGEAVQELYFPRTPV